MNLADHPFYRCRIWYADGCECSSGNVLYERESAIDKCHAGHGDLHELGDRPAASRDERGRLVLVSRDGGVTWRIDIASSCVCPERGKHTVDGCPQYMWNRYGVGCVP